MLGWNMILLVDTDRKQGLRLFSPSSRTTVRPLLGSPISFTVYIIIWLTPRIDRNFFYSNMF